MYAEITSSIWPILEKIAATNSNKEKIAILEEHKEETLLSRILYYTYNPHLNFYITGDALDADYPDEDADVSRPDGVGISKCLEPHDTILEDLIARKITGNAAKMACLRVCKKLCYHDMITFKRILNRDLRIGISAKTVNKVWPGLIPEFGVMLCSPANEKTLAKINFPAAAQLKLDGMRAVVIVNGDDVQVKSRSGKDINLHGEFDEQARILAQENSTVFDGELLVVDDNEQPLDRKTGNGILNKAVKGTMSEAEAKRVRMVIWDTVKYEGFARGHDNRMSMTSRFKGLELMFTLAMKTFEEREITKLKFTIVSHKSVDSLEEAQDFAKEMMKQGHEGIILKDLSGAYECKRVNHQLKFKAELEADLKVVGWIEGTGRNVGRLGALVCTSADGGVQVNVGSGFSDHDRDTIGRDIIGSIITVKYNEVIKDKNSDKRSLFLPRYVEERLDKTEADTL